MASSGAEIDIILLLVLFLVDFSLINEYLRLKRLRIIINIIFDPPTEG